MGLLRIKELMIKKNITRDELAVKVGISATSISNICSEANYPKYELLPVIAEALDVDIRELFNPTKGGLISHDELKDAKELLQKGMKLLNGMD